MGSGSSISRPSLIGAIGIVLVELFCAPVLNAQDGIRVAFSALPPWKFVMNKRFEGAYAELAKEVASQMKIPIEFIECPLKRCLRLMETGAANLIIGVRDTADRQIYIRFLETPYRISSAKVFYLRAGEGRRIQEYTDLYELRIGTKLGAKYFDRFNRDSKVQKTELKTNRQNFEMLKRGRIDALIIAEDQGEYWISQLGYRDELEKAPYFHKDYSPRSIGISRRSTLIEEFDALEVAMQRIVATGKLENIIAEHYFKRFGIPMDSGTFHSF